MGRCRNIIRVFVGISLNSHKSCIGDSSTPGDSAGAICRRGLADAIFMSCCF